mmetsp:Transcript_8905/g.20374  ORF Transcript_8905/g.20374 Transcript_8905/m.20374 type:complete len:257 (-) Transcript_8905:49-819(-)
MPLPPPPTPPSGCPGCASGARCLGKPGEELYLDDFDSDRHYYCNSCWEAGSDEGWRVEEWKPVSLPAMPGISETLLKRIVEAMPGSAPPALHPRVEIRDGESSSTDQTPFAGACIALADAQVPGPVRRHTLGAFLVSGSPDEDPLFSIVIGPLTCLSPEDSEEGQVCTWRLVSGSRSWLLRFAAPFEAVAFARDFRLRSREMKLALQVSRLRVANARLVARAPKGGSMSSVVSVIPALLIIGLAFYAARFQAGFGG